jgi:hypothetical protein
MFSIADITKAPGIYDGCLWIECYLTMYIQRYTIAVTRRIKNENYNSSKNVGQ